MNNRYIPAPTRRVLRQEVNFCCPLCGCPVLEYHHIIPWHISNTHQIDDMIALCPNCHAKADNGAYDTKYLCKLKAAGFDTPGWKDTVRFDSDVFTVKVGSVNLTNMNRNHNVLLEMHGEPMLAITRRQESNIILNTCFYNWVDYPHVAIKNNELIIDTHQLWDIEYNGKKLTLRQKAREISLMASFNSKGIWFKKGTYRVGTSTVCFDENSCVVNSGKATTYLGKSNVGTIRIMGAKRNDFFEKNSLNKKIKTDRNEPCPCGSGLKYKKCCGCF